LDLCSSHTHTQRQFQKTSPSLLFSVTILKATLFIS